MEKNTILAFALSFLVLLAWAYLFAPKQEPVPPPQAPEVKKTEPAPQPAPPMKTPEPAAAVPRLEKAEAATPAGEPLLKDIHVETPLYYAMFSSAGARLKSFRLKNYHTSPDPKSPLVELMPPEATGANQVGVTFGPPSDQARERLLYQVSADKVVVNAGAAPQELTFSASTPEGTSITQTFRFHPDRYPIELTVGVQNPSASRTEGNFRAFIRNMLPKEAQSSYSFMGLALLKDDKLQEIAPDDLKEDKSLSGRIGWMAFENEYFMTAFIPQGMGEGAFLGKKIPSEHLEASLLAPAVQIQPGSRGESRYILYLGPRDLDILKEIGNRLEVSVDFGWTDVIAKPLLYTLRFFNRYVNNYGVAIIILTVLVKILFWPLTHKSYQSMKEMQKIQPLMAKIREKYKNNREQMNKEMMALYKTYKVNPMGGCLPMVIQIPVFFALFRILGSAIELRHAPFMLWINDLSAPDRLFSFPFEIPFMSPPYGIPVLTLLMGASMFIQQKMTPTPGDQTQAKVMMLMPIIFTAMFINFPSGLVLYWLINNILSIGQQYRILKKRA
ncbi:MAG: membrane protein insertase YidC [Thermodesulfobacteriota bacterium]